MSLGHFKPRQQKLLTTLAVVALPGVVLVNQDHVLAGGGLLIAASLYIAYQTGRSVEHEKMKGRKWYAQKNYNKNDADSSTEEP